MTFFSKRPKRGRVVATPYGGGRRRKKSIWAMIALVLIVIFAIVLTVIGTGGLIAGAIAIIIAGFNAFQGDWNIVLRFGIGGVISWIVGGVALKFAVLLWYGISKA